MERGIKMDKKYTGIQEIKKNYIKQLPTPSTKWPPSIQRAVHCIHKHLFDEWLGVEDVKKKCVLKGNNFSVKFRYYVGISPKKYIIKHRLKVACQLLEVLPNDLPLMHIAISIGFSSHAAFTQTFKRRKEVTPSQFRQQP